MKKSFVIVARGNVLAAAASADGAKRSEPRKSPEIRVRVRVTPQFVKLCD
jgi:hypothetical protein